MPTLRMAAPKRTVAGVPKTASLRGMFHVAVLAPNAESRSPNQFRPERIRFTSWSSRTPYATCWVRTSSTPPVQGAANAISVNGSVSGASVRRNHFAVSPHSAASCVHPSSSVQAHVSCELACSTSRRLGQTTHPPIPQHHMLLGNVNGRSASLSEAGVAHHDRTTGDLQDQWPRDQFRKR